MKIKNTVSVIIGIAFCAFSTFMRAQCPQTCNNSGTENTFLGADGAGGSDAGFDNIAVGFGALVSHTTVPVTWQSGVLR